MDKDQIIIRRKKPIYNNEKALLILVKTLRIERKYILAPKKHVLACFHPFDQQMLFYSFLTKSTDLERSVTK